MSPTFAGTTGGLNLRPLSPTVMGMLAARLRGRRVKMAVARVGYISEIFLLTSECEIKLFQQSRLEY